MSSTKSRGVQGHDVARAADELIAQGMRPTIERVRLHLGRGSPNTIAPLLDQWFSELAPRLGLAPEEHREQDRLPGQLAQAMASAWQQARELAQIEAQEAWAQRNAQLAHQQGELEIARQELHRNQQNLTTREAAWQHTLDQLKQDLTHWKETAQQTQAQLEQAQNNVHTLNERLRQASNELLATQRRHEETIEQLASNHRRESEGSRADQRRLLAEVDELRQHNKRLEKSLSASQSKSEAAALGWEHERSHIARQLQEAQVQLAASLAREQAQRDLLAVLQRRAQDDASPSSVRRKRPLRATRPSRP